MAMHILLKNKIAFATPCTTVLLQTANALSALLKLLPLVASPEAFFHSGVDTGNKRLGMTRRTFWGIEVS